MASKRKARIGSLLIPTDPFWVQTLEAIIKTAQHLGDELVILQPAATMEDVYALSPNDLVEQILAQDLDALICTLTSIPITQILTEKGLPLISLGEIDYRHPNLCAMSSLYQAGWMAGQFLGQRLGGMGHVICASAGGEPVLAQQTRVQGFHDAVSSFGGIDTCHIPTYWSYAQIYPAVLEALRGYPRRIDGIFGISDTIILAARDAARELGVIDDKTLLVGINGDPQALADIVEGSLTATVDMASESLGEQGVLLAHRAAQGLPLPPVIPQEFHLITQENAAQFATRKLIAIAGIPTRMVGINRQVERDRTHQLEISTEITRQIGSLVERSEILQAISGQVREHYGFHWVRVYRWSKEKGGLEFYGGELSPAAQQVPVEQDSLIQQVFSTNETIYIPDIQTGYRWKFGEEWKSVRARAILPIASGCDVIGVLDLQSPEPIRQTTLELVGLNLLAGQINIAIKNADLYQQTHQAQEAAERANQLKTRLVANVGHEMRTPLNAILGFSQTLRHKLRGGAPLSNEELEQDLHHIYKSGEHLMYMINDLLDLSRAEIGALNLYFEPVQPVPFLKEIFQEFAQSDLAAATVRREMDIPERLPIIQADTVRLRQIFMNLLTNAAKFTRLGSITLGARVEIPYLHFWVQDTGQGVPVDLQAKIFEPFGNTGRKRRSEGIGLGLSITRHLVELHNGMITLESQPGSGSTFHVYLPMPGVAQPPARSIPEESLPVLLVMTRQIAIPEEIRQICETHKLIPHIVIGRDDLNRVLAEGIPAAIAWDLSSASVNEWSLIYQLNQNQKCAALPVILYGSPEDGAKRTGLTNVVFKPCGANAIRDWIAQIDPRAGENDPVLIVDDDPEAREHYRILLRDMYPQRPLRMAANGAEALNILRLETPALILLDLMMPEIDGFTVLERIRCSPKTQRTPVVIISGKLLSFDDIQRLNHARTVFTNKGVLTDVEMAELIRQVEDETHPLPQPTSMVTKHGLAFLHQNYTHPITRKDIAAAVGVSENYFSQIFRQEMSISPWDYLARLRINKARYLLHHSEDSITHIALSVGFNDPAYFSRVFHKVTGQSAQEYRNKG